jgi:hypothetical protein
MRKIKVQNPWRSGLIIATTLCALFFLASLLWQAGYPHWGFVLLFGSLWLLTGLILSNDGFNEESGLILASVLDENVDFLLDRIETLETTLANVKQVK